MYKRVFLLLIMLACVPCASVLAQGDVALQIPLENPYRVVMNLENARVFVKSAVPIQQQGKEKVLYVALPADAKELQLRLEGKNGAQSTIRAWHTVEAVAQSNQGTYAQVIEQWQKQRDVLFGQVQALRGQELYWHKYIEEQAVKAAVNVQEAYAHVDAVGVKRSALLREIAEIDARIAAKKPSSKHLLVRISLETPLQATTSMNISYAYTLPNARWQPVYTFDAQTKAKNITARTLAKITQQSGFDWKNVDLTLTTVTGEAGYPSDVAPWVVRKRHSAPQGAPQGAPMLRMAKASDAMMEKSNAAMYPRFEQDGVARWDLAQSPRIAEGDTLVVIAQETWQAELHRLARPAEEDTRVWLYAKHAVGNRVFPVGIATFLLDGIPVGKGPIRIEKNMLSLFFGIDPLVRVETQKDIRKSAKQGIINKRQSWAWSWSYTLYNQHTEAVKVRLEEPRTELEDAAMEVTYADTPKAQQGPDAVLFWDVSIPAQGTSKITRAVTVTAPEKMQIYLGR